MRKSPVGDRNCVEKCVAGTTNQILKGKEMVVQRLASHATGKAVKFERLGPLDYVPYPFEEVTVEGIKKSCFDHFKDRPDQGLGAIPWNVIFSLYKMGFHVKKSLI